MENTTCKNAYTSSSFYTVLKNTCPQSWKAVVKAVTPSDPVKKIMKVKSHARSIFWNKNNSLWQLRKWVSALKQTTIHLKQKGLILQEKYFLNSLLFMHDNISLAAPEGNLETINSCSQHSRKSKLILLPNYSVPR